MRLRMVVVTAGLLAGTLGCGRPQGAGRVTAELSAGERDIRGPAFAATMPGIVVWAWEEPEDLRALDPARVGVAYLAETVILGDHLHIIARHQPLRLANGTRLMAAVRVESERGFRDTPELRLALARELASVAARPGLQALQVDFDAVESQHSFYAGALRSLRRELPPGMPLSVTALVSWCRGGGWMRELPVAEAVPMFFRMGGPAAHGPRVETPLSGGRADTHLADAVRQLRPPCLGSVGVSTDERWPPISRDLRVYLFSPRPWTPGELDAVNRLDRAQLSPGP